MTDIILKLPPILRVYVIHPDLDRIKICRVYGKCRFCGRVENGHKTTLRIKICRRRTYLDRRRRGLSERLPKNVRDGTVDGDLVRRPAFFVARNIDVVARWIDSQPVDRGLDLYHLLCKFRGVDLVVKLQIPRLKRGAVVVVPAAGIDKFERAVCLKAKALRF